MRDLVPKSKSLSTYEFLKRKKKKEEEKCEVHASKYFVKGDHLAYTQVTVPPSQVDCPLHMSTKSMATMIHIATVYSKRVF